MSGGNYDILRTDVAEFFQNSRREMERLFNQFASIGRPQGPLGAREPLADIAEDNSAYRITLEIPGVEPKDTEVNLIGSMLTVRAERQESQQQQGRNVILTERTQGQVRRDFRLPDDVDRSKINAEFRNGVLTLTLPKSTESKERQRRIEIKSDQ